MEWFAMSSKFWMDLDDKGVSESAQTLLVRACGYMALNETGGFLPKSALKKLGLRSVSRRVDELIRNGIAAESCDGSGYDFPAWFKWNAPLERQVRKKKADRDRIAQKRSTNGNVARQSRGVSRDVACLQNRTEQEIPTQVPKASHVSDARDPAETPGSPVDVDGWKLVRALIPIEHPQAVRTALAIEAGALLKSGTSEPDVREALTLWLGKERLGPKTLPSLVSEVIRSRAAPTPTPGRGTSTAKAEGWLNLGQQLATPNSQKAIDQ